MARRSKRLEEKMRGGELFLRKIKLSSPGIWGPYRWIMGDDKIGHWYEL